MIEDIRFKYVITKEVGRRERKAEKDFKKLAKQTELEETKKKHTENIDELEAKIKELQTMALEGAELEWSGTRAERDASGAEWRPGDATACT